MGTNAAPMIANLALFMSEFHYIKMIANNIKHVGDKQWTLLRQLSYCNRFIDDQRGGRTLRTMGGLLYRTSVGQC